MIDNLMAVEKMLRGEPTRCIHRPIELCNPVRFYGKHVRSNYIITQLVNYGDENLQAE